jgi:hypothetical protein
MLIAVSYRSRKYTTKCWSFLLESVLVLKGWGYYDFALALKQSGELGCCLPCHHHNSQQPPNAATATYDLICES